MTFNIQDLLVTRVQYLKLKFFNSSYFMLLRSNRSATINIFKQARSNKLSNPQPERP